MLKFYFVRVQEPWMSNSPSWNHKGDDVWRPVDGVGQDDDSAEATWRWLLGKPPVEQAQPAAGVAVPMALLQEDNEAPTEKERTYSTQFFSSALIRSFIRILYCSDCCATFPCATVGIVMKSCTV